MPVQCQALSIYNSRIPFPPPRDVGSNTHGLAFLGRVVHSTALLRPAHFGHYSPEVVMATAYFLARKIVPYADLGHAWLH